MNKLQSALAAAVAVGTLALAVPASAASGLKLKPWVYDPEGTGVSQSQWITGQGLLDAGKSKHALYLTKLAPTSTLAASGASIEFSGTLTQLGFDYRNDGHAGAGAPRFNVYTTAGTYYFFGAAYGTHTASAEDANWTRVTFTDTDAFPADGVTPWPGFGTVDVTGLEIVFDEGTEVGPGFVYLDNINVNGTLIGRPGNN